MSEFAEEFPLQPPLVFLNHAAVAPWPQRAARAVEAFAQQNIRQGPLGYAEWEATEQRLRQRLCRLLNADSTEDVALIKNTSEGLSIIAHGLPWQQGDNVVTARQEFPSNRYVWQSLSRYGVETRFADLDTGQTPEDALLALTDEHTRLVSLSAVQYATGLRPNLARIGNACHERGILFCVDAIQALGAVQCDVNQWNADFAVADGHKWMLGPEGLGVLWCRPELRERLSLHQIGWHMVMRKGEFDRMEWSPAPSARRFEPGSPNMLGVHALEASLSLLEGVGLVEIEQRVLERSRHLVERLTELPGIELVTPKAAEHRAGIVTFRSRHLAAETLYQRLRSQQIICAHRAGGIRLSPHFYTSCHTLDYAIDAVARCLQEG